MGVKVRLRILNILSFSLSSIGIVLSLYSFYVEHNLIKNPNAKALCDISEHMSCTKAFSSKYGKGFGFLGNIFGEDSILNLPNSIPGTLFYIVYCILSLFNSSAFSIALLAMSVASIFMTAYLAYILLFILKDICVICFSIHIINIILLVTSYRKQKEVKSLKLKMKTK